MLHSGCIGLYCRVGKKKQIQETVSLPPHSWRSTGNRSENVFPEYFNIVDSVYVCDCRHNYRCAVPPKLSLEKGMGMTPGYNHRLRLRNMLPSSYPGDSCSSPGLPQPIVWGNAASPGLGWGLFLPHPSIIFFLIFFIDSIFKSLSVRSALFGGCAHVCSFLSVR